jgi:hypothetical protein
VYGPDTSQSVRSYQASAGQPSTGAVTTDQWTSITGAPVPGVEERALQLTSTFEGHGYGLAQGNWDGAWLTWGIVGFTLRHGEVQAIVVNVDRLGTGCVDQAFGNDAAQLRHIVAAPAAEQEAWANGISVGARLAEPWRTHFQQFGTFAEVQAEQRARAHADYFVPALQTALAVGLQSELGIALCFDIHVQNGGVGTATCQAIKDATVGAQESVVREALANAVADHAKPEFQNDVRQRKLAIARGQGVVHQRQIVLLNWGLADVPAVVA